ncbi:hypothetical protein V492_02604 [Pseudogymnoascus sp. VKM F-4246]|nr:hypothetical protein V492_02604 [Pseudogymnoascus sp. VKM F-4246]
MQISSHPHYTIAIHSTILYHTPTMQPASFFQRGGGGLPQRGRRGRGVLGSRTVPAMAGNVLDAQVTALVLEHEEALLHNTAAEVEEVLNRRRDAVGLPSRVITVPAEAFEEACRLERMQSEALTVEREAGDAATKKNTDAIKAIDKKLDRVLEAVDDILGTADEGLTAKQAKDMRRVIDEGLDPLTKMVVLTQSPEGTLSKCFNEIFEYLKGTPVGIARDIRSNTKKIMELLDENKAATSTAAPATADIAATHRLVEGLQTSYSDTAETLKKLATADSLAAATTLIEGSTMATKEAAGKADGIIASLGKDGAIGAGVNKAAASAEGALAEIKGVSGGVDTAAKKIAAVEELVRDARHETKQSFEKTATAEELSKMAAAQKEAQEAIEAGMAGLAVTGAVIEAKLGATVTADDLGIARSSLEDGMRGLATAEKLGELTIAQGTIASTINTLATSEKLGEVLLSAGAISSKLDTLASSAKLDELITAQGTSESAITTKLDVVATSAQLDELAKTAAMAGALTALDSKIEGKLDSISTAQIPMASFTALESAVGGLATATAITTLEDKVEKGFHNIATAQISPASFTALETAVGGLDEKLDGMATAQTASLETAVGGLATAIALITLDEKVGKGFSDISAAQISSVSFIALQTAVGGLPTTVELDEKFTTITTAQTALSTRVGELPTAVKLNEKLDSITATVGGLPTAVMLDEKLDSITTTVGSLATAAKVDEKLDAMATTIGSLVTVDEKLAAMATTIGSLATAAKVDEKLDSITTTIGSLATAAINEKLDAVTAAQTTLSTIVGGLATTDKLEEFATTTSTASKDLMSKVTALGDAIKQHGDAQTVANLAQLQSKIAELEAELRNERLKVRNALLQNDLRATQAATTAASTIATLRHKAEMAKVAIERAREKADEQKALYDAAMKQSQDEAFKQQEKAADAEHTNKALEEAQRELSQLRLTITEQDEKIIEAVSYRESAIEAVGVMKGRYQVEKEMAVAAAKVEIHDVLTAKYNDEVARVTAAAKKEAEAEIARIREAAKKETEAEIARIREAKKEAEAVVSTDLTTKIREELTKAMAEKEKAEQEVRAIEAHEKQSAVEATAVDARAEQLIAEKEKAEREAKERADDNTSLRAQLLELRRKLPAVTVAREFDLPRRRALTSVETPHGQLPHGTLMVTPEETPSARRRGSALEDDDGKRKRRALSASFVPSRAQEWAVVVDDEEVPRPQFMSRPVPFMAGGSRPAGFGPVPPTPSSAMSVHPAVGSLEQPASRHSLSPGSPSVRFADRNLSPTARPASISSQSSGQRSLFAGARAVSMFSSGPVGLGLVAAPAPASVSRDPSQGHGVFAGSMAAPALPARAAASIPSGTITVRSPRTMAVPVDFLVTGRLRDGAIADSVSAVVIDQVAAKVSEWWARAEANRPGSGRVWHQPTSKRILCVELKSRTSRAVVAQPASDFYDPQDKNPAFACPHCIAAGLPCVWSTTKTDPARVLPLPVAAREPGATPQTEGYYVRKVAP